MYGAVLAYCRLAFTAADNEFEATYGDHVLALAEVTTEAPNIIMKVIRSAKAN
jgi:hypothetical protein